MGKSILTFSICVFVLLSSAMASENKKAKDSSLDIVSMWDLGEQEEILAIGQQRLIENSKDLLGLLIVLQDALFVKCDADLASEIYPVLNTEFEKRKKEDLVPFDRYSNYWREFIRKRIKFLRKRSLEQKAKERDKYITREIPFYELLYPLLVESKRINLLDKFFAKFDKPLPISKRVLQLFDEDKAEEVYRMGRRRLWHDNNDILGLIIQFEEALDKCDKERAFSAFSTLDKRIKEIKNKRFKSEFEDYKETFLDLIMDELKKMTPRQLAKEREFFEKDKDETPILWELIILSEQEGLIIPLKK